MMKKLIYAAALLLVLAAAKVNAQTFMDRIHFEFAAGTGARQNGIKPVDFSFKSLVDFVSISYLFVTVEDNISLYRNNNVKSYSNGVSIGGGLGVKLLNGTKGIHGLDVRAKALTCAGNLAWKRTTYDAALAWYIKSFRFSPVVELGYRYLDSRTAGLDNYGNAYLSIGLRY